MAKDDKKHFASALTLWLEVLQFALAIKLWLKTIKKFLLQPNVEARSHKKRFTSAITLWLKTIRNILLQPNVVARGNKKQFNLAITLWLDAIRNMFALFPLFRSEATQNFRVHFSAFSLHQNPDQILAVIPFLFSFLITRFRHTFYAVSMYTLQIQCTTNAVLPAATQASVL